MRFKTKKRGATRIVTKFALFPTRIDQETIVWLEWYTAKQVYEYGWITFVNGKSLIEPVKDR